MNARLRPAALLLALAAPAIAQDPPNAPTLSQTQLDTIADRAVEILKDMDQARGDRLEARLTYDPSFGGPRIIVIGDTINAWAATDPPNAGGPWWIAINNRLAGNTFTSSSRSTSAAAWFFVHEYVHVERGENGGYGTGDSQPEDQGSGTGQPGTDKCTVGKEEAEVYCKMLHDELAFMDGHNCQIDASGNWTPPGAGCPSCDELTEGIMGYNNSKAKAAANCPEGEAWDPPCSYLADPPAFGPQCPSLPDLDYDWWL
ncbi:MAG: hypothetical protein GY722_08720 [bacterium]|nr:hypothetical protein [bacterium]